MGKHFWTMESGSDAMGSDGDADENQMGDPGYAGWLCDNAAPDPNAAPVAPDPNAAPVASERGNSSSPRKTVKDDMYCALLRAKRNLDMLQQELEATNNKKQKLEIEIDMLKEIIKNQTSLVGSLAR